MNMAEAGGGGGNPLTLEVQLQLCMFHGLRQGLEGLKGIIDRYEVV